MKPLLTVTSCCLRFCIFVSRRSSGTTQTNSEDLKVCTLFWLFCMSSEYWNHFELGEVWRWQGIFFDAENNHKMNYKKTNSTSYCLALNSGRIRHSQYRPSGIQIFIALSHLRSTKSNDCNCMDLVRVCVRVWVRYHSFASIAKFIHNMRLICLFHLNVLLWRLCAAAEDQFTYLFASHNRRAASRATACLQSDACSATWWFAHMNGTNDNGMHSVRVRTLRFLLALNAKAQTNFHNNNFQIEWSFIFRAVRIFFRWFLSLRLARFLAVVHCDFHSVEFFCCQRTLTRSYSNPMHLIIYSFVFVLTLLTSIRRHCVPSSAVVAFKRWRN